MKREILAFYSKWDGQYGGKSTQNLSFPSKGNRNNNNNKFKEIMLKRWGKQIAIFGKIFYSSNI